VWNLPPDEAVQLEADIRREPLLSWSPKSKKGIKRNYFVPSFGRDEELNDTRSHYEAAQKTFKTDWDILKKKEEKPKPPHVPNFGRDEDINASMNNLDEQEKTIGEMKTPEWDDG